MKIGLYVHIPFCQSKCYYCDFLSFAKIDQMESYTKALVQELKNYSKQIKGVHTIKSIFIGGGTPTVLTPILLEHVCETICTHFQLEEDYEWTVEANPGTVTKEHIEVFKRVGVNRVSLGLQACQSTLLKEIGRIHQASEWKETVQNLQNAGIYNINTDIMFGLPKQTVEDFEETLKEVVKLGIPHLSAYSLIIEEGTLFYSYHEKGMLELPDEEEERKMYELAKSYLKSQGYEQYEISNWAKENKYCKHNTLYWEQDYYIGCGLGAHSYMDHYRFNNTESIKDYIESEGDPSKIIVENEMITEKMAMEEFMFLGLRMIKGIRIVDFEKRFRKSIFEIYGDIIDGWIKENILVYDKGRIFLSERGIEVSNTVFTSFL